MSLIDVVNRFRTPGAASGGSYSVTRSGVGAYDPATGEYATGTPTTFAIVASVQPYSEGRHTVTIPEGIRTEDIRQLWTTTELRVTDDLADTDVILIPGGLTAPVEPFFVFGVEGPWTMNSRTHYHVWCARRKQP